MVRLVVIVLGALGAWPGVVSAQTSIDGVAWWQGCWQLTHGDRTIEEHWTSPKAGAMPGSGRTIRLAFEA
jgi:hypothetical protein